MIHLQSPKPVMDNNFRKVVCCISCMPENSGQSSQYGCHLSYTIYQDDK